MPNRVETARQILNSLFKNVRAQSTGQGTRSVAIGANIPRGSIVRFGYRNWHHDPYPVVIVTDISWSVRRKMDGRVEQPFIKGINLNYLTPFDFQRIIRNCGNPTFSYRSIMGDKSLSRAYRHYLIGFGNILNLQLLDCQELVIAREISRAYDPNQMDAIKQAILEQLQIQANIKAADLARESIQSDTELIEEGVE